VPVSGFMARAAKRRQAAALHIQFGVLELAPAYETEARAGRRLQGHARQSVGKPPYSIPVGEPSTQIDLPLLRFLLGISLPATIAL
jgi:hypothetical protein